MVALIPWISLLKRTRPIIESLSTHLAREQTSFLSFLISKPDFQLLISFNHFLSRTTIFSFLIELLDCFDSLFSHDILDEATAFELIIWILELVQLFNFPTLAKSSIQLFKSFLFINMTHIQLALISSINIHNSKSFQLSISKSDLQSWQYLRTIFTEWEITGSAITTRTSVSSLLPFFACAFASTLSCRLNLLTTIFNWHWLLFWIDWRRRMMFVVMSPRFLGFVSFGIWIGRSTSAVLVRLLFLPVEFVYFQNDFSFVIVQTSEECTSLVRTVYFVYKSMVNSQLTSDDLGFKNSPKSTKVFEDFLFIPILGNLSNKESHIYLGSMKTSFLESLLVKWVM